MFLEGLWTERRSGRNSISRSLVLVFCELAYRKGSVWWELEKGEAKVDGRDACRRRPLLASIGQHWPACQRV